MPSLFTTNDDAPLQDPKAWDACRKVAGSIAAEANKGTSAKVGITYQPKGSGIPGEGRILVGPAGAPAHAVEFGTATVGARRYFKRALDGHRT